MTTCEYDDRYYQLEGFETNEYTVQEKSGVLDILKDKPENYITDEDKANIKYKFWAKPNNEWRCSPEELDDTFTALDNAIIYENDLPNLETFVFKCTEH